MTLLWWHKPQPKIPQLSSWETTRKTNQPFLPLIHSLVCPHTFSWHMGKSFLLNMLFSQHSEECDFANLLCVCNSCSECQKRVRICATCQLSLLWGLVVTLTSIRHCSLWFSKIELLKRQSPQASKSITNFAVFREASCMDSESLSTSCYRSSGVLHLSVTTGVASFTDVPLSSSVS